MPLYEYQCEACGHRFEVIQKFSDPPLETCPKCNGVVRKLLSSPAIQFKGSGWYITDYGRAGKTDGTAPKSESTASTDGSGTTGTEKKTETKTETKVESKPETKPASS
jgi:putative FmdB family regulatory protein